MDQREQNKSVDQLPQEKIIAELTEVKETLTPEQEPPKKPKSKKALIWCLSILTVIALAAATVFAYLYFTNQNNKNEATTETEAAEQTNEPTVEETEITDTYILRDLDEKIAILHETTQTSPTLVFQGGLFHELPLYKDGDLSDIAKVSHIAQSINEKFYLGNDERQSVIDEEGYTGDNAQAVLQTLTEGIKAETMAEKYYDVFGEELIHGLINGQHYCPDISYNKTYNFYYEPIFGCGGTGPYTRYYYKNKYTTDEDHAYVYISAATVNGEDNKIYCDVIDYETFETNPPKVCGEYQEGSDFALDNSNYQNFAQYRFVFNKADDGTYYFDKVEKL